MARNAALSVAIMLTLVLSALAAAPPHAVPVSRAARQIAVITIHGAIDEVTRASVSRRLKQAQADGARAIVLELDTPGGDLSSTLEICLQIKERTRIPVYAWVHPRAYSAGTIIALACEGILVSPNAVFGDAAPIQAIPGMGLIPLPTPERAKIEAPVLAEIIDSARRAGYDEALVRSFVTASQEVWMLRNKQTGERVFVDRREYIAVFGQDPPLSRGDEALATRAPLEGDYTVRPSYDDRFRKPDAGAQPAPSAEESAKESAEEAAAIKEREAHIDFMQIRPPTRAPLTAADASNWELVAQVDSRDELLVLYAAEARAFGLAQEIAANDQDLLNFFGATQMSRYDEHWGDALVRFLTSWPVRLVLVVILLAGFLVEIAAPGIGWFGGAATVALVLLMGAPMLAGVQSWWPIVLVMMGVLLVVLEIFVIPGFGVIGLLGAGCIGTGLVAGFIQAPLSTPEGQNDLTNALAIVVGGGIVSVAASWFALRLLPRTKLANAMVLHATTADIGPNRASPRAVVAEGAVGMAVTPLRPVGKVDFAGTLVEVQSVGSYVEAGRRVVVVRADAYAVEVEECSP